MTDKKIAVLIPCYNEALTIAKTIKGFTAYIPEADIYVYDNNSTDGTDDIAKLTGLCAGIGHCPTQGKGATVRRMLQEIDADLYILVDGDATYDPYDARKMLGDLEKDNLDMIAGDRSASFKGEKLSHSFGNRLVDALIRRKSKNKSVKDVMSGLRIFDRSVAEGFAAESIYNGFEIETELTLWCLKNGKKIASVPISYGKRPAGSKSKLNTIRDGMKILKLIHRTKL